MPLPAGGSRRLLIVLALALGVSLVTPAVALGRGSLTAVDVGSPVELAASKPYTLDLVRSGDFVAQKNFVQCVGASMQMMLNMIRPTNDRTAATQRSLQDLARSMSPERPDGVVRKGASIVGWTAGLNAVGAGPYRTVGSTDLQAALKLAARAMRETGRPVGLLVWRGRHAWVMAGFTATADPRLTDEFEVTSVVILDPLYPYGSRTWGPSPKPGEPISIATLGRQFVPRGFHATLPGAGEATPAAGAEGGQSLDQGWSASFSGKYVIVAPYEIRSGHTGSWAI